jgi:hypothetical protein
MRASGVLFVLLALCMAVGRWGLSYPAFSDLMSKVEIYGTGEPKAESGSAEELEEVLRNMLLQSQEEGRSLEDTFKHWDQNHDGDITVFEFMQALADLEPIVELVSKSEEELLTELQPCMTLEQGWWTYKWCHKKEIRQFHKEPDGTIPQDWSLGKFDTCGKNGTFYSHLFIGGQRCDETRGNRSTEAQFYCCDDNKGTYILSISEPATCQYTLKICAPALCTASAPAGYSSLYPPCGTCKKRFKRAGMTLEQRKTACKTACPVQRQRHSNQVRELMEKFDNDGPAAYPSCNTVLIHRDKHNTPVQKLLGTYKRGGSCNAKPAYRDDATDHFLFWSSMQGGLWQIGPELCSSPDGHFYVKNVAVVKLNLEAVRLVPCDLAKQL